MKYNRTLALILTVVMVAAAVFLGLQGKPVSRDDSLYITDKAGVISSAGEAAFVQLQQSTSPRLSVAVVKSTGKLSTAAYCEALWNNWNLGTSDMLLLMVTGKQDYYFGYDTGSSFAYTLDANFDALMERYLEPDFAAGSYEQAILTFSAGIQSVLAGGASGNAPYYPDEYYGGSYDGSATGISVLGLIIVIAFIVVFVAVVAAGSVGSRRTVGRTVYRTSRPITPPPPRPRTTSRPVTPPPASRPRTTIRTTTRPRSTGGFGGGSRPRSGGFGGGGRSGGFGGGGRSGGMRGGGRR